MKPRFVRLFIVMVVLVAAFVWLGRWQWNVAHSKASDDMLKASSQQARVPLERLIRPQTEFDNAVSLRPVTASGTFDDAKTELVAGRVLNKRNGWWVMTPLVVDSTGARLPIVRGFVTRTTGIPPTPKGHVVVEGALAPGESASTMGDLPKGQIGAIDMGLLLNDWGGTVYNAFLFSTKQIPSTPNSAAVQSIPPPVPERSSIEWRNAAYAVQWWVFAGFAVFMWVKLVREETQDEAGADDGAPQGPADAQAAAATMGGDAVPAPDPRKDHS